jgi:hypothetical protein
MPKEEPIHAGYYRGSDHHHFDQKTAERARSLIELSQDGREGAVDPLKPGRLLAWRMVR